MVSRVQISASLNSTETGRKLCEDLASLRLLACRRLSKKLKQSSTQARSGDSLGQLYGTGEALYMC